MTQNNLGNALGDLGVRTPGNRGVRLLDQSVTAYRAALEVTTRKAMPVHWAETQGNIGLTFETISEADPDNAAAHLGSALAALDRTLEIFGPDDMPHDFQKATEARDRIAAKLSALED